MKPRRRPIQMMFQPGSGRIVYQALGVVGIVSPWNYPVQLTLAPLAGAIAAGNRVMIKPSELTPRTSALLEQVISEVFDPGEVLIAQGGAEVARAFSELDFDHLLFTGSTAAGRQVMRAAAENLVPVTLELGGKSPACIAPDYVMVPRGQEEAFVGAFRDAAARLYPSLEANPDYTAIVNERHYGRLRDLVADARARGAAAHEIN